MSYSVKMPVLNMEIQFSAADQKDLWRQVSLFQSLPATCPIDDTPARLNYRYVDENDFFEVVNTGPILYKYLLGQYKKGGDLFPKNTWVLWDADRKEEIVLWENGRLTPAGERCRIDSQRRAPRTVAAIGQVVPEVAQGAPTPRQAPAATFTPGTPETQQATPIAMVGEPAEPNPFLDPNAGAKAPEREPLIVAIHELAKTVYGKREASAAMLNIAAGITKRDIKGLMELSYEEIARVDAIVKLERTGFRLYKGQDGWYKALRGLLPAKTSIYDLDKLAIDRIHADLPIAS